MATSNIKNLAVKEGTVPYIDLNSLGNINIGTAWDNINIYNKPVIGRFKNNGYHMFIAYKYSDGQYGMMQSQAFYENKIYILSVSEGVKTIKAITGT